MARVTITITDDGEDNAEVTTDFDSRLSPENLTFAQQLSTFTLSQIEGATSVTSYKIER